MDSESPHSLPLNHYDSIILYIADGDGTVSVGRGFPRLKSTVRVNSSPDEINDHVCMTKASLQVGDVCCDLPKTGYALMNTPPSFKPDMRMEVVRCLAVRRLFDHFWS